MTIYYPVWIDAFAETEEQRGLWMTLILLAANLAYVVGYGFILAADYIGQWHLCFYFMVAVAVIFTFWISTIPNAYLDPMLAPDKKEENLIDD